MRQRYGELPAKTLQYLLKIQKACCEVRLCEFTVNLGFVRILGVALPDAKESPTEAGLGSSRTLMRLLRLRRRSRRRRPVRRDSSRIGGGCARAARGHGVA